MSDELVRLLANMAGLYEARKDIKRQLAQWQSTTLSWRTRPSGDYLYERPRHAKEKEVGRRADLTESRYAEWKESIMEAKARLALTTANETEHGALIRRLGAGFLDARCATVIRGLDYAGLIGREVMSIGSPCIAAYLTHAMVVPLKPPDGTADVDFTWIFRELKGRDVLEYLLLDDPSFKPVPDQPFRVRNSSGFDADVLVAPAFRRYTRNQTIRPAELPEQGWLLLGRPVDVVVCATDGTSARMFCPDPRYYGLQKIWLSRQDKRNTLKRPKDARQGGLVLDLVAERMTDYPLDATLSEKLPSALKPILTEWLAKPKPGIRSPDWKRLAT